MPRARLYGTYSNCQGIDADDLRARLVYIPLTGALLWGPRDGRGGGTPGSPIVRTSFRLWGHYRNTFGIIYLLVLGRLPMYRVPFRDQMGMNWAWENIKPLENGEVEPPEPTAENRSPSRRFVPSKAKYPMV